MILKYRCFQTIKVFKLVIIVKFTLWHQLIQPLVALKHCILLKHLEIGQTCSLCFHLHVFKTLLAASLSSMTGGIWSFLVIFSSMVALFSLGSRSVLLRTTNMEEQTICPMTRHSAVCVWMPLVQSTTSTMRSMICAPPMIVLIREAWPGQSTKVTWSLE